MFLQYRITVHRGCSIISAILDEHVAFFFSVAGVEARRVADFVEKYELLLFLLP
jgi:hypothetical protein